MLLPGAHSSMRMGTGEEKDSTGNIRQLTAPRLKGRWPVEDSEGEWGWEVTLRFI